MKNAALSGKSYAGNPHVRFDEGEVVLAKSRRGALLYKMKIAVAVLVASACVTLVQAALPDEILKRAAFWLDASTLTEPAGSAITTWTDPRGADYPAATSYKGVKPQVIEISSGPLAGKKAVTFFSVGTQCDMQFPMVKTIKTAFFVVDLDQAQNAFLMCNNLNSSGNDNTFVFHRGSNGSYQLANGYVNGCTYWNDGRVVSNPTSTVIPTGYQLITWIRPDAGKVNCLTQDRTTARVGGKRLCELIVFEEQLTDVQRSCVEGYLKAKWYGAPSQEAAFIEMFGKKANVHFDASVASSFHYEVAGDDTGTLVSRWDDLSGNNNHFTPFHPSGAAEVFGTRGVVNGVPAYMTGTVKSAIDMQLTTRVTTARCVILVADVENNPNVFWLGDKTTYRLHRGNNGSFAYNNVNAWLDDQADIWYNGEKITAPITAMPEGPGGASLFIFNVHKNVEWQCLGCDRNTAVRSGGKQVSELITYNYELGESDRKLLEQALEEKWKPSKEYVDGAYVHVSASALTNFTYSGSSVTGWKNSGTGDDLFSPETVCGRPAATGVRDYTNGVPAFLMGPNGSLIDLAFPRTTQAWSVFWVMDIVPNACAFWLGDGSTFRFHRGLNGQYAHGHGENHLQKSNFRTDGMLITNLTGSNPPAGLHVYDATLTTAAEVQSLSADRGDSTRNGGRALSELFIFTNKVTGLTRKSIRDHLLRKWVKTCGWADGGDVTWGSSSYRVFSADGEVPAEGASAAGIGFIDGSAVVSGGALALGSGGVFVSEGATGAISASIANGPVHLYGFGTFKVVSAVDYRLDFTKFEGSVVLADGSHLTMNAYQSLANRPFSLEGTAKITIDLTGHVEGKDVLLTFASLKLPEGVDIADIVDFGANSTEHSCVLSADGLSILLVGLNDPVTATWVGEGDRQNPADSANWECKNFEGTVLPGTIPTEKTCVIVAGETSFNFPIGTTLARRYMTFGGDIALTMDCDWRGLGVEKLPSGAFIDLNGHRLVVGPLGYVSEHGAGFGNTATALGELCFDIPQGTSYGIHHLITGNIKVVKEGSGTFEAASLGQAYTGGTEIKAGTMKATASLKNQQLGLNNSTVTVRSGSTFDVNGQYDANSYAFVLDGGTFANLGSNVNQLSMFGLGATTLTTNSTLRLGYTLLVGGPVDLGGHTLTVSYTSRGEQHLLFQSPGFLTNGTIKVENGGWLRPAADVEARTVDFDLDCALNLDHNMNVHDYTARHTINVSTSNRGELNVYGTFTPCGVSGTNDFFYGCTMQNGSAIDLSARTNQWSTTSSYSNGRRTISFAENAVVTVKLGDRRLRSGDWVIVWDEQPETYSSIRFVLPPGSRGSLSKQTAGVRYQSGLAILIR